MSERKKKQNSKQREKRRVTPQPRKKRRRLSALARFLIAFTFLLVAVAIYALFFMKIETLQVKGKTQYTQEQILAAGGLKAGNLLFLNNKKNAAASICEKLPYIASARVYYIPLQGVGVKVEQDKAVYLLKYSNGYAAIDEEYKVRKTRQSSKGCPLSTALRSRTLFPAASSHRKTKKR